MNTVHSDTKKPTSVDAFIGKQIRKLRKSKNISQEMLGNHLGVTFQQVQKYENGTNRVGGGRLQQIADYFETSIVYFFPPRDAPRSGEPGAEANVTDALDLVNSFNKISDPRLRSFVLEVVRVAATR